MPNPEGYYYDFVPFERATQALRRGEIVRWASYEQKDQLFLKYSGPWLKGAETLEAVLKGEVFLCEIPLEACLGGYWYLVKKVGETEDSKKKRYRLKGESSLKG